MATRYRTTSGSDRMLALNLRSDVSFASVESGIRSLPSLCKDSTCEVISQDFNAKDAKRIRKGTQRRPSFATFAENFAAFAFQMPYFICAG